MEHQVEMSKTLLVIRLGERSGLGLPPEDLFRYMCL